MYKFEQKEMTSPMKSTLYSWLLNYIPEPTRKSAGCFNDKIFSLFDTNTPKKTLHEKKEIKETKNTKQN